MSKLISQDANKMNNKPWQIDETVNLLDMIETNGDNWDSIVN